MMIGYMLLAVLNGMMIGLGRAINSRLSINLGPIKASFWNHAVGFFFLATVLLITNGLAFYQTSTNDIPLFTYLGGFFGALFVAVNSHVFSKMGATKTVLLVMSGQMISSVLIEYKSGEILSTVAQFFGVASILLGVYLAKSSTNRDGSKQALVSTLLDDQSYHIEFNGHLTNHNKHAVIALQGLGASEETIYSYYKHYAMKTPYGYALEHPRISKHIITQDNWQDYLGKRISFSSYCEFFSYQERKMGMNELLRQSMPVLLPGWVGSLTHATIHLGWALDAGSRWMAIEGLAYMAFSYRSCHPERAMHATRNHTMNKTVFDSLCDIATVWEDSPLRLKNWVESVVESSTDSVEDAIHPELLRSGLQYKIARILAEGHPLIYAIPLWVTEQDIPDTLQQLYYVVSIVYMTQPGDFLILHLLTSLHAIDQIASRLPIQQQIEAITCFWMGMLCILFSIGTFPKRTVLVSLHEKYKDLIDASNSEPGWQSIIDRAVCEEEEHNPKLVYVLQRIWKRFGHRSIFRIAASHFTSTPVLPKSFETPPIIE